MFIFLNFLKLFTHLDLFSFFTIHHVQSFYDKLGFNIFKSKAQDSEERNRWVSALEDTIFRHTYKRKFFKKLEKVPTIEEYQRRLNETNLYLTILNDQIKIIDDKIFNSGIENDEQQLVDIKVKTLTLIDSIKHTILLLELTKVRLNFE